MPTFYYSARTRKGEIVSGTHEAPTEPAAVSALQSQGLIIVKLVNPSQFQESVLRRRKKRKRITTGDITFFVSQTASLLEAGIPLLRALEIIAGLNESANFDRVLKEIMENIRGGSSLRDSLARHPKVFPPFWAYLIEAGETSGNLPFILNELAKNLEAAAALRTKIMSALIYPSILVGVSFLAILVFMLRIIPIFQRLYTTFNAKLPPLTTAVLAVSAFLQHYLLLMLFGTTLGVYGLRSFLATPAGRSVFDRLVLKIPAVGTMMSDVIHARISIILSTLTQSGLNLLKAIEITGRATGSTVFEQALNDTSLAIQQGRTLSAGLRDNPVFSPMLTQLVMIGEESGKLPDMIERASKYFSDRVELFTTRIGILIEPIILVFVGSIVGLLVIAMFMPIFSLSQAIR